MSYSKPVPPFILDTLYYLNRDQLERFSVVCRPLKNFIDRYFQSKPYRVFDQIKIRGGSYALIQNDVQWHPNRDDYSIQQFLANHKCIVDEHKHFVWRNPTYYSFAEMRPYLGPTVRIIWTPIYVAGGSFYNPEQIAEMESIAYLWHSGEIDIMNAEDEDGRIVADDFQPILNSPTILQCRKLSLENTHFSFKDYKVLFTVNTIDICCCYKEIDPEHWVQFLEQPGVKPVVVFRQLRRVNFKTLLDLLSNAFSSAVLPNAFKIVVGRLNEELIEFRESNKTSGEKLELKKGLPVEYQNKYLKNYDNYTLERSCTRF